MRNAAIAALLGLSALAVGCRGARHPAPSARDTARAEAASLRDSVALTPYERCALRAYQERNDRGDDCMIRCLARGAGRNIGGGCWHICYAYTGRPMILPPGLDRCRTLADTLGSPRRPRP